MGANHSQIDFTKESHLDLAILEGDLADKDFFLCGENHGVQANEKLRLKFLKFFKEKTDFTYYLWELPFSTAYFFNQYLKSGDELILETVYKPFKATYAWNEDSFRHWQDLYIFNKSLPPSRRIKIVGIDIEHQSQNAFRYILEVLPPELVAIRAKLQDFGTGERVPRSKVADLYQELENAGLMQAPKRHYGLRHVLHNLLVKDVVYGGGNFNDARDKQMYQNLQAIYKNLPPGKFFGQFGLSHVFQNKTPMINWFASLLNGGAFPNKILSIAYLYQDCRYLYPTKWRNYKAALSTLRPAAGFFSEVAKSEATIFKLNNEGSPFSQELLWPIEQRTATEGTTTSYFQYLVLIKNSLASAAL